VESFWEYSSFAIAVTKRTEKPVPVYRRWFGEILDCLCKYTRWKLHKV